MKRLRGSFFADVVRGHPKSMLVVEGGWGSGSLKNERKQTAGGGSSLSVRSLCEKNCLIFQCQTEFFLISCLAVAESFSILSLDQHIKVFFY